MNKLWLIIAREYHVRVRTRSFWIGTLIMPLGVLVITLAPSLVAVLSESKQLDVLVLDPSGEIAPALGNENNLRFLAYEGPAAALKDSVRGKEHLAAIILPGSYQRGGQVTVTFLFGKSPGIGLEQDIRREVKEALRAQRLQAIGIPPERLATADFELDWNGKQIAKEGEQASNTTLAMALGFVMMFMIYFLIIIYGSIVMRGVLEEKSSRIVEVIVSSVRPLQLMFGKIIGIGAVGLTQFLLWVILGGGVMTAANLILLGSVDTPEDLATASPAQQAAAQSKAEELLNSIRSFDWGILWFFPLYFIGGFFFYGSLYGALAASVEDESEVQSYTFIILFPLILPLILFGAILKNPNGPLAFWLSEIPLTSPLVMMMRLASTDVPVWEVLLSIGLLFGGVLGVAWMAAKIYRMAILMYGKKLSLKEMARLVRT